MKRYEGPWSLNIRYEANSVDYGRTHVTNGAGGGMPMRIPLPTPRERVSEQFVFIEQIEIPEEEADATLAKTLRIVEQERTIARLEIELRAAREQSAHAERRADQLLADSQQQDRQALNQVELEDLMDALYHRGADLPWIVEQFMERLIAEWKGEAEKLGFDR